jgi:DNA repair protein RadA/Sms
MKISEPAADLAVAAALLSAREDAALPPDTVIFGEISLSGALRPAPQTENRLKEAQKLGFTAAIAPAGGKTGAGAALKLTRPADLTQFVGETFGAG